MVKDLDRIEQAYNLLQEYKKDNPFLLNLKNQVFVYKKKKLEPFEIEYIEHNHDKDPILVNKVFKVAKWYGDLKQEEWKTEFPIEKIQIGYVLGETDNTYHAYIRYRRSQENMMLTFLPKKAVLSPLFVEDYNTIEVDFSKYEELGGITMKDQQKKGVKFLLSRKKGILSLQMGSGKSLVSIVAALEGGYKKILVVCPASLKTNWRNEIKRFVNEDEITIVEGSKWKENTWTILNYDIIDNFYEVPTETIKQKVKDYDDDGNVVYVTKEKEITSRKKEVVQEALENSQLFLSQFDLVIIDEAHKLSNSTSIRYKTIFDFIKKCQPLGIFELTGTIINNNPKNLYNLLRLIENEVTKDWQDYMIKYCEGKQIYVKGQRDKLTNAFLRQKGKHSWYDLTSYEKDELNRYLDKNCKKIWLTNGASNLDELRERVKHLYLREDTIDKKMTITNTVKILDYDLSSEERIEYENAWNDYVLRKEENGEKPTIDCKQLIEGSILRQATANLMLPHTIQLVNDQIANGDKVVVFCSFDNEVYSLQEYYGDKCVIYNGKLTAKQKDKSVEEFMHNDDVMVFIGNIDSAGVGLTLTKAHITVFNSVSFLPSSNEQCSYRCYRLGQEHDCIVYYQKFNDTYMDRIFEILDIKNNIINSVIVNEEEKHG